MHDVTGSDLDEAPTKLDSCQNHSTKELEQTAFIVNQ